MFDRLNFNNFFVSIFGSIIFLFVVGGIHVEVRAKSIERGSEFTEEQQVVSQHSETNSQVLERIWKDANRESCTTSLRDSFSDLAKERIRQNLKSENRRADLTRILNKFLLKLGYSHTEFFDSRSEGFHFFRSHAEIFNPKAPKSPPFYNPGIQLTADRESFWVREVLGGSSAHSVGILRGDKILSSNREVFEGFWSRPGVASLKIERDGKILEVDVEVTGKNLSKELFEAQKRSEKIFEIEGRKFGYARLWTGTHPESAKRLQDFVVRVKDQLSGLILDLRGGYGGAWWQHLDPFFENRENFFEAEIVSRDQSKQIFKTEPKVNREYYSGPMAVLINEGVRSGKEALAFQFKKSGRAKLIGVKTPGYFTVGKFLYADEPRDYVFYLCHKLLKLDGHEIEGVGISPDIEIPFSTSGQFSDNQLEAAIEYLLSKSKEN